MQHGPLVIDHSLTVCGSLCWASANYHSLVFVDDGIEEFAVSPAGGEVVTADVLVAVRYPLGPQQQLLLGRHVF